jgi:phosphatidylinositol 4-kinase
MTYQPSDTTKMESRHNEAVVLFTPHETWLRFIISRFFAIRHKDKHLVHLSVLLLRESFQNAHLMR